MNVVLMSRGTKTGYKRHRHNGEIGSISFCYAYNVICFKMLKES